MGVSVRSEETVYVSVYLRPGGLSVTLLGLDNL